MADLASPMSSPTPAPAAPASREPSLEERARHARAMHHRQIVRRTVIIGLVVGLLIAVGLVAVPFVKQLTTQWALGSADFAIDWQIDSENLMTGGVTAATYKGKSWMKPSSEGDLVMLPALWNLLTLSLQECDVSEQALAPLSQLAQLRELDLSRLNHMRYGSGPTGLNDACLVPVQGLTNLERLTLSGNRITDAGLATLSGLRKLEILDLDATDVTDAGLVHLQALGQLKVVDLAGTQVTPQGVKALQAAMPGLEVNLDMDPQLAGKVAGWRRTSPGTPKSTPGPGR